MKRNLSLVLILAAMSIAMTGCDILGRMFPGTWTVLGSPGFSADSARFVDIGIDEVTGTIYVAFQDGITGSVSVMKYEEFGSQTWEYLGGNGQITGAGVGAEYISLLVDDGTPIISFSDATPGVDGHLSVMEFNGSAWEYVGPSTGGGISSYSVTNSSLLVDGGTLYVAYRENFTTGGISNLEVSEFNGASWSLYAGDPEVVVGSGTSDYIDLQSYGGTMYVSYSATGTSGGSGDISVLSTTGSGWSPVGGHDIYGAEAQFGNMVFGDGTLYMAFAANNGAASVMSYENSQWAFVDQPAISSGRAEFVAADYYDGDIIVAYKDFDNDSSITAQLYNGRTWSTLGEPGFTQQSVDWVALAGGNAGYYVAFSDSREGGKVSVYVYH